MMIHLIKQHQLCVTSHGSTPMCDACSGLIGVDYYRCGINPEHLDMIQANPVAIKPTDTRAKRFIKEHGNIAYELDAFHPEQLEQLVYQSIEVFTDMESVEDDREMEVEDLIELEDIKEKVMDAVYG